MRSLPASRHAGRAGAALVLLLALATGALAQAPGVVGSFVDVARPDEPVPAPASLGEEVVVPFQVTYSWDPGAAAAGPTTVMVSVTPAVASLLASVAPETLSFDVTPTGGEATQEVAVTLRWDADPAAESPPPAGAAFTVLASAGQNGAIAASEDGTDAVLPAPSAPLLDDDGTADDGSEVQALEQPQGDTARAYPWLLGILVVAAVMYVAAPVVAKRMKK